MSSRLASVAAAAEGLVRQLASSASGKRLDVVCGQVACRSALGAVGLPCELHLPELLPCTVVATLRGRASALLLLPLVLAQALAAAAAAVAVRLVATTASVADADLHVTLAGAQTCASSGTVSRVARLRRSLHLFATYRADRTIRKGASTLGRVQSAPRD